MEAIKRKWFLISLAYVFVIYYYFIVHLKGSNQSMYYLMISLYLCVTAILFLGNIIGFPGLVLHAFFRKEDKALPFYQAAYRLGAKSPQMLSAYGLVLLRNGESAKAKEVFETALKDNKNIFYTRTLKANIAISEWKLGNIRKAYDSYMELYYFPDKEKLTSYDLSKLEEGLELNSTFSQQDFLNLGYLAHLCDERDAAIYFSKVALLKQEDYAAAYDNLGQIYYKSGDIEDAKASFAKAIELKPTLMDSLFYSAKIAYDENNLEKGKEYFEKADALPYNALCTVSKDELKQMKELLNK